jgi:nucleoside phosphorylase
MKRAARTPVDRFLRRSCVVILTALDLEYQAVRAHLDNPRTCQHPEGTFFEIGRVNSSSCRLAVVRTGQGNTPAALIAERAIAMFRPKALFFVGIAGALHDDLELGDVVVATKVYAFHGGKVEEGEFLSRPQVWEAPHGLEQLAGHIARTGSWVCLLRQRASRRPGVHFKPIAAGEVLVNSRAGLIADHIHHHYNDAIAVDMESVGMACAGHLNRSLPVLSIRGISDRADGHKSHWERTGLPFVAAGNAAAFAVALATGRLVDQAA